MRHALAEFAKLTFQPINHLHQIGRANQTRPQLGKLTFGPGGELSAQAFADNESEDRVPEELQPLVVGGGGCRLAAGAMRDRLSQQLPPAKAVLDGAFELGKFGGHVGAVKTPPAYLSLACFPDQVSRAPQGPGPTALCRA